MEQIIEKTSKYINLVMVLILIVLFFRTCGNDSHSLSKKVEKMSNKLDSLQSIIVTKNDLEIEGLKSEKRMIQSTDRKILDVNRQSEIDKEIEKMSK